MRIQKGAMEPRPTDKLFDDSPDTGMKECICSRCGSRIQELETCIRITTTNKKGKVDKNSKEYRYCEFCMSGVKYFHCQYDEVFSSGRCDKQCDDCKDGRVPEALIDLEV